MVFQVKFSRKVAKPLRKLDKNKLKRIKLKFQEVAKEPFRYLEHYEGENFYKLRIGDYRALIDVDFDRKILFIRVLDKRGRIYKR